MAMPRTKAEIDAVIGRTVSAVFLLSSLGAGTMYGFAVSQERHCFRTDGDWPVTRLFQHAANAVVNLGVLAVDDKKRYCPMGNYFTGAAPIRPEAGPAPAPAKDVQPKR